MKLIKLALVLAGIGFAAHAGAETDEAILFNEGDQPMDAEEATLFPTDTPDAAMIWIQCNSNNYRTNRCYVDGRIRSVRLARRTSFAPCIAGRTFGASNRYVWVSRGCSGQFAVRFDRRGDHGGGHGGGGHGGGDHGGHGGHH